MERFCVHLSLPSSTEESSDLILHVTYSFVDSVSAYDPNVDDTTPDTGTGTDTDTDADADADAKTIHCDLDKDFYRLLHLSTNDSNINSSGQITIGDTYNLTTS